jgi:hypothetical protein
LVHENIGENAGHTGNLLNTMAVLFAAKVRVFVGLNSHSASKSATSGKGATTYMVDPTTTGAPSWPYCAPSENVHAILNRLTLLKLVSSSWL